MSTDHGLVRKLTGSTIVVLGLAALIAVVYAVVVLVLGHAPVAGERGLLLWSVAATAIAVALAFPVRGRLRALAQRLLFSERGAANDIVRNFGSHASRSVPLDDLLLHAAESLRTSLGLTSSELWVVVGDSLALKVSDPEHRRSRIPMGAAETGSVARSGVTGPAWLRVWLPELLVGPGR